MAERTPFDYRFGIDEGRLRPTGFYPQDGDYAFVLGSEYAAAHDLTTHDKIEIYQNINLSSVGFVRLSAGLFQPAGLPKSRVLSGHYSGGIWVPTATLKYTEVLGHPTSSDPTVFHPSVTCEAYEPYTLPAGATLKLKMDGGSEQSMSLGADGIFTAAEIVARINAGGLSGVTASATGYTDNQRVQLTAANRGRHATLQISGGSSYPVFRWPLGSPIRMLGGLPGTLTHSTGVAHIPGAAFSSADLWRLVKISGSASVNNGYYLIIGVGGPSDVTLSPAPALDESGTFLSAGMLDGVYTTRVYYGGDDFSAIIAPDANFTEADTGVPVRVSGASNPGNNYVNFISSVQSAELAILRYAIVDEPVGFNASILGVLWRACVLIDDVIRFSTTSDRNKTLLTNDIAVNVSKLTGTHKVGFRLELATAD